MPRLFAKQLATATLMTALTGGVLLAGSGTAVAATAPVAAGAAAIARADDHDHRHRHRHCDSDEIRKIKIQYANDHERRRAILKERGCPDN